MVNPVQIFDMFGFVFNVHRFRGRGLHFEGEFVAGNSGSQVGVVHAVRKVVVVEVVEVADERSLFLSAHLVGVFQIENGGASGAEDRALIAGGHVAAGPVLGAADGASGFVEHDDVAGQVLVHGAKSVVDPRTERGASAEEVAGVHH